MKPLKNTVVNVKTQKEYDKVMEIFESFGWTWSDGEKPTEYNHWGEHEEKTCIRVENNFGYCDRKYYKIKCYTIISFNELMAMQKKTLKTLEVGDYVKDTDGDFRKVIAVLERGSETEEAVYIISLGGGKGSNNMRVTWAYLTSYELEKRGYTIDQPDEVSEMTVAEVCKALGKTVKIVK